MRGREAPGVPIIRGPHIHEITGYVNEDGSGEGNYIVTKQSVPVGPQQNDAADRLRSLVPIPGSLLDAALAAERRATVERIRDGFLDRHNLYGAEHYEVGEIIAILDAERDR